jgi:hypothetical protein
MNTSINTKSFDVIKLNKSQKMLIKVIYLKEY